MTWEGNNQEHKRQSDGVMRDEEYRLHQRLPLSFNDQTMSAASYPHTYHYGIVQPYDTDLNGYPTQFYPSYLATSGPSNTLSEDSLQTGRILPYDRQDFVYPVSNQTNSQVDLSTEQSNPIFRFNNDNIAYFLPGHMNTSNLSLNIPSYSQSTVSPYLAQYLSPRMVTGPLYSSLLWPQPSTPTQTPWLESSVTSYGDEGHDQDGEDDQDDDDNYDRPYAQLIYQCLFEAEGHRMLLRDIYEWFEKYTKKPQESGSKGWQNSIRHNLSMNKAFENDKNDPAAKGGARKANSVWVLTEHAMKHGVESTTRYRKNATSRRSGNKRTPALQRQRSGARGGRATRRAARVRLSQESQQQATADVSNMDGPNTAGYDWSPISNSHDLYSPYGYSPTTPSGDQMLNHGYSLPYRSYCDYGQQALPKLEEEGQLFFDDQDSLVRQMLCQSTMEDNYQDAT